MQTDHSGQGSGPPGKRERLGLTGRLLTGRNLSSAIVVVSAAALFVLFGNLSVILQALSVIPYVLTPFLVGFGIAFLLNPFLNFFERVLLKRMRQSKRKRALCLIFTYLVAAGALVFSFAIVIPTLVESVTALASKLPGYLMAAWEQLGHMLKGYGIDSSLLSNVTLSLQSVIDYVMNNLTSSATRVAGFVSSTTAFVVTAIAGVFISVYVLAGREHLHDAAVKGLYVVMKERSAKRVIRVSGMIYANMYRFIVGQMTDSFLLGIVCFLCMLLFRFPYPLLISVIIMVTNVVPMIGPFIGAVPCTLFIMVIDPIQAFLFVVFVILLQQFDANIIGPRVVGDVTGLKPFWLMFSITVGGGLFGVLGVLFAIPVFSVVYILVKEFVEARLERKSLPIATREYL